MHPQIAPLCEIATLNSRLFLNALEEVTDEQARQRPAGVANSMVFVALHLLDARCYLARMLGAEASHPYEKELEAVQSIDEMQEFPALEDVRAAWREASSSLDRALRELTAERLIEKAPAEFPVEDRSTLGGVAFLLQHESFHIGQLALLRRQVGLGSMGYRDVMGKR